MTNNVVPLKPKTSGVSKPPTRITSSQIRPNSQTAFHRTELSVILSVYGHMVSQGHWKDYAMDFLKEKAVFSIYRQASEQPLYRIEKTPALKAKQGQYSVIAPGGLILKRGHDLKTVLRVFDKQRFRVTK
ncbi:MAG: DUF2794 domain-containing protein [Maricaulaceae bacterium]